MLATLAIIFGFMVFMLIVSKGHLVFINLSSLLVIGTISLAVGYGMAALVISIGAPLLKILGIAIAVIVAITLLIAVLGRGGEP